MATKSQDEPVLLRWSEHIPSSDVQDPLGLGLRGSARLASRLLYCITSITPRARYFSFIPWCVFDWQTHEKGNPYAFGLREAIVLREQALTLGCVAHHEGKPCDGGALVGSRDAVKWLNKGQSEADFRKMKRFSKNPALSAYFNSLVNLGFFVTEDELPDSDEENNAEELTFDAIELSDLGRQLAEQYNLAVGGLKATKEISFKKRKCSVRSLAEFGKRGGLCEMSKGNARDSDLLVEIFFGLTKTKGDSHQVRRKSLLLILELCRQLSAGGLPLTEDRFAAAAYYGVVAEGSNRLQISIPDILQDIGTRWRMFYFHHYMGVALEGLFAWLVSELGGLGLVGATVDSLTNQLRDGSLRKNLQEIFGVKLDDAFGALTPANIFSHAGLAEQTLDRNLSKELDRVVGVSTSFAEDTLEQLIRSDEYLYSSTGLALPLILLAETIARYTQWDATNYGQWLAGAADDPFLDLVPPVLSIGLAQKLGDWWNRSWVEIARHLLSRYVIRQHESLSYEKSWRENRCLIQVDGDKLWASGGFNKIAMGNPRFGSAVQILEDLGLLSRDNDGMTHLSVKGNQLLRIELARDVE